jgi:ATP-binding cassette subfamily F protein 3
VSARALIVVIRESGRRSVRNSPVVGSSTAVPRCVSDEPTNHLDFPSVTWLTHYLKNVEHTLLVVSHDREFLNAIITDVIDLTEQRLDYYHADYTGYLKRREEAWTMRKRLYENQQKKM